MLLHECLTLAAIIKVEHSTEVVQVVADQDHDIESGFDLILPQLFVGRVGEYGEVLFISKRKAIERQVIKGIGVGGRALVTAGDIEHLDLVLGAKG